MIQHLGQRHDKLYSACKTSYYSFKLMGLKGDGGCLLSNVIPTVPTCACNKHIHEKRVLKGCILPVQCYNICVSLGSTLIIFFTLTIDVIDFFIW